MKFEKINVLRVRTTTGIEIGYLSKFEIEYKEDGKRLIIPYEIGASVDHIYAKAIRNWNECNVENGENIAIGFEKKQEIIRTLNAALDFLGIDREILE